MEVKKEDIRTGREYKNWIICFGRRGSEEEREKEEEGLRVLTIFTAVEKRDNLI